MKNTFSSDEQVKKSYEFLAQMDKPACPNCQRGVRMCKHTPCLGTVDDMEKLINAGYAKNLMLDWWVGTGTAKDALSQIIGKETSYKSNKPNPFVQDVCYLVPAIIGSEGKLAKFAKVGTCNLLVDDKCSLHNQGLKPIQGQYSCCSIDRFHVNDKGEEVDIDERIMILHTWNNQRGLDLIEKWKKEVAFTGETAARIPTSFPDMLESLFDILTSHADMYSQAQKDPDYENRQIKRIELPKPY